MGLDIHNILYYGVAFDDVYELIEEKTIFDIHDIKTGVKTGETGTDTVRYYRNICTGIKYDPYILSIPIADNIYSLDSNNTSQIIGIRIDSVSTRNSCISKKLAANAVEDAIIKYTELISPLIGTSEKPRFFINTYLSH